MPQLSTPLVEQSYKQCPLGVWLFLTKTGSSGHCILTPSGRTNCVSLLVRHPQQVRAIQRPPPAHSGAVHGNADQHGMDDLNSFASIGPRIVRAAPVAPSKVSCCPIVCEDGAKTVGLTHQVIPCFLLPQEDADATPRATARVGIRIRNVSTRYPWRPT